MAQWPSLELLRQQNDMNGRAESRSTTNTPADKRSEWWMMCEIVVDVVSERTTAFRTVLIKVSKTLDISTAEGRLSSMFENDWNWVQWGNRWDEDQDLRCYVRGSKMEANKPTNRSDTRFIVLSRSSSIVTISVILQRILSCGFLFYIIKNSVIHSQLCVVSCSESNYSVPYDHVVFRSIPNLLMHAYSVSRSNEVEHEF